MQICYLGEDDLERWDNWFCEYSILKNKFLYISCTLLFKGIVSRDSIFTTFIKFCEVTPVHTCVRWCFALKGQCHKIFCLGFFSWIIFPQAFEIIIRIISNVYKNFQVVVHHLYQWHRRYHCCCYRRQIFRGERLGNKFHNLVPSNCDLRFADPNFFANLKLLQSANSFFLLTNTYLKCSNSKFYQIKNSA